MTEKITLIKPAESELDNDYNISRNRKALHTSNKKKSHTCATQYYNIQRLSLLSFLPYKLFRSLAAVQSSSDSGVPCLWEDSPLLRGERSAHEECAAEHGCTHGQIGLHG